MRLLMLAPPGGGKGTQGIRIAEELGLDHISSGDLLRKAVAQDTPLGREVEGYMQRGRLAPDDLVTQAVRPVLEGTDDYVLDGFPRTLAQAEGVDFDHVIYLDVPEEEITRRLLGRGRADDTQDVIEARLRQYHAETLPLVERYNDVLMRVDGNRPPDQITADLLQRLKKS